jgi:Metallo-beta-lactamase superfamily
MSYLPVQQISGLYHRKIGDIVVTAVSDGYIDGNLDLLKNVSVDEARAILVDAFRPVRRVSINAFLVHTKGGLVLIDTGTGGSMGATNGWIGRNLAAAGLDAKDVSAVLLTHMHPDHSAGLTDTSTGRPIFPNAELVMHEAEPRYWLDDGRLAGHPHSATFFSSQSDYRSLHCGDSRSGPKKRTSIAMPQRKRAGAFRARPCPSSDPRSSGVVFGGDILAGVVRHECRRDQGDHGA